MASDEPVEDGESLDAVRLAVRNGVVRLDAHAESSGSAELRWPAGQVRVTLFGEEVETTSCRVPANGLLHVEALQLAPRNRYMVNISRDRMEATLRIVPEPGYQRHFEDAPSATSVQLQVVEEIVPAPIVTMAEVCGELQAAGVLFGIEPDGIRSAMGKLGDEVVIAKGLSSIEGRKGYLEHLVDFESLMRIGVLAETPLLRRVRKREGTPGRDVTDRVLAVAPVKDVRIRPGRGVTVDERGIMAIAAVDGAPWVDREGNVEVRHELVLEVVDTVSGDIEFNGSIKIEGDVGEGRRVIARDEVMIEGNVDRALVESGGSMVVTGSIMSSVLRAGGERAVAATIADRVLELPKQLGIVAAQARQFRDQGSRAGTEVSHGLSIQLVLERVHRGVLPAMHSVVDDLREAGPGHVGAADRAARWHRMLATSANVSLTSEQFQEILVEVSALVADVQRAIEVPADLTVSYMQASEAEATGVVTLVGKGIFNSRIVAWGGLDAHHRGAVLRGGSVLSHGSVQVHEIGSPAGARTLVQITKEAGLEADLVYAGTVVNGPGYTHRFVADRSCVKIDIDSGGSMNVASLAA